MSIELFECERLRARITRRQCEVNKVGQSPAGKKPAIAAMFACVGCPGLGHISQKVEVAEMGTHRSVCKETGCTKYQVKGGFCWNHAKSNGINPSEAKKPRIVVAPVAGAKAPVVDESKQSIPVADKKITAANAVFKHVSEGDISSSVDSAVDRICSDDAPAAFVSALPTCKQVAADLGLTISDIPPVVPTPPPCSIRYQRRPERQPGLACWRVV